MGDGNVREGLNATRASLFIKLQESFRFPVNTFRIFHILISPKQYPESRDQLLGAGLGVLARTGRLESRTRLKLRHCLNKREC